MQSRYYDPGIGRFLNADAFASTGQGILGNNMFAYCNNNPAAYYDSIGYFRSPSINSNKISLDDAWASGYGGGGGGIAAIGYLILSKFNSKKPINLPSHKKIKLDMDHISSGHMPGGNRNPDGKKSVFCGLTTNQVIKAIYEAYETSSRVQTQGERIRIIGYSGTYNLVIEIWLNVVTKIIETAYPK